MGIFELWLAETNPPEEFLASCANTIRRLSAANRRRIKDGVDSPTADADKTTESDRLRALLLKLGSGVQTMTQNYLLTVRQSPRALTDGDVEMGNTREYQDGFVDALNLIATEHVQPLVTIYNDVMKELAA